MSFTSAPSRWLQTSDQTRLHLTDSGPAHGPAFVLIAGFTAPTTSWVFQEEALRAAGHRVVCVDRRSHGLSESPAWGHRMARHGQDLSEVLDDLHLPEVILVGGSMGASTIWSYLGIVGSSARHRVRAVVSIDQTPRMLNSEDWPHGYYGFDLTNAGTHFATGIPETGRGRSAEASQEAVMRLVSKVDGDLPGLGDVRPETLPLLNDHAWQDWRDVVAQTDVDVLALAGRDSQLWPCEHAEAMASLAARGRALVVDECGHAMNIDRPDAVNAALLAISAAL